jgi:outer membrane protein assembly factor BamA
MTAEWDTRDEDDPYYYSAWAVSGLIEYTGPDLDSDFDYTRYRLAVSRHQRLNRRLMVVARSVYGGSEGALPMHKRFYLGGLGTLHGYQHKELSGSRFWMANLEYRIDFPHSDLAASLMWDVGQISPGDSFEGAEVKHSLGAALHIGSKFKVGLARRLDRSYDNDPQLFARFAFAW